MTTPPTKRRKRATLNGLIKQQARVLFLGKTPEGETMPRKGRVYAAWFLGWGAVMPAVAGVTVGVLVGTGFPGENVAVRIVIGVLLAIMTRTIAGPLGLLIIAKTSPLVFKALGLPLRDHELPKSGGDRPGS